MFALSRVIVVLSFGLSVSVLLRERLPRLLWWMVGAQLLAVAVGCTMLYFGDTGGAGSTTSASTRLLICVFGPATVLSSLAAAKAIDTLNQRRAG